MSDDTVTSSPVVHTRSHGWCSECGGTGKTSIKHVDEVKPYLLVKDFLKALGDAGILHDFPNYNRVVIDADIEKGVVMMYVNHIPSEALLSITPLMRNATVVKPSDAPF